MGLPTVKQVKQTSSTELLFVWSDGRKDVMPLKILRDACPCAGCKGETVLLHTYTPPPAQTSTPGRYDLKAVETIGGYALKFTWGDGHDMGIYTWEHLRDLGSGNDGSDANKH
jgi:DUF971 family protein